MTSATTPPDERRGLFSAATIELRLAVFIQVARALLGAWAALSIGALVDRLISDSPTAGTLLLLAIVLAGRSLISALSPPISAAITGRVEQDLQARLLHRVLALPPSRDRRTGDLVSKATEGVGAVGVLAGVFLPQLIAGMAVPVLLVIAVALIDVPSAVVLVLAIPAVPLLLRLLESRFSSVTARYRQTADRLAARFLDAVQGLTTLKTLNQTERFAAEIEAESERLRTDTMRLLRVNQLALLAVDSLFTLGTVVAAAGMAGVRLSGGAITLGEAVSIVFLGSLLIDPLSQIGRFFYVGAIGRSAAAQVRQLLALPADTAGEEPGSAAAIGEVELEDVTFTYPDGTRALAGIDLHMSPGQQVALIGPSGAGKTTLAHLILGLLTPDEGRVRRGGEVSMVPQRPFLFPGTIADNLRLAWPAATDQDLWQALAAAELADTVRQRGGGLDSQVGERGVRLSVGEVQRLAIARAVLVDAPIVVLDEPTSNVDLETEARIRSALERLIEGRTVLVIAHRRSTLEGVDRVVRLDAGRLAEAGSTR